MISRRNESFLSLNPPREEVSQLSLPREPHGQRKPPQFTPRPQPRETQPQPRGRRAIAPSYVLSKQHPPPVRPQFTSIYSMGQADSAILAVAMVVAGYLITMCATPPNPPPEEKDRHNNDRIRWIVGSFATISRRTVMAVITFHALLTILPEYAPARLPQMCRQPQNRNPGLFSWSAVSTSSLLSIYAGAFVRLAAYGGLGEYFTFHLAAPGQLVTTGVYRWIQHPSYTGVFLLILGDAGLFLRWDATPACLIAGSTMAWLRGLGFGVYVANFVFGTWTLMVRVRDEEEMLRQHFGKEWEDWHRTTKRFIPGLL